MPSLLRRKIGPEGGCNLTGREMKNHPKSKMRRAENDRGM